MPEGLRLALTGVPGVGKTSVASALAARHGALAVHLNEFAQEKGLLGELDAERGSRVIDMDELAARVNEAFDFVPGPVIYEGHFAHEMDADVIVLLRVDPALLVDRLRARGWREEKVRENVEAEALDVLAQEVLDAGVEAYELDATRLGVEEAADAVWAIAEKRPEALKGRSVGSVRWSLEALPWF